MRPAPAPIEATLFYGAPVSLQAAALLGEINAAFADRDLELKAKTETTKDLADYTSDRVHVRVRVGRTPLDPEAFETALKSPITQLNPADFRGPVFGHNAWLKIEVSAGPVAGADAGALYAGPATDETRAEVELRHEVGRFLVDCFIDRQRPMAIHWGLSDKLLTVEEMRALRRDPYPLALFLNPALFSSGAETDGVRVVGFHVMGSEHLLGRRIIFQEAPLPYTHLLRRTHEFVSYCRAKGRLIPDGDSFGTSEADVIRVRHQKPSEALPTGAIELTYEQVGTEALAQISKERKLAARLHTLRTYVRRFVEGNRGAVTYALCALTILVAPVFGAAILLYNMVYGPRLRPTGLIAALAVLLTLSGAGLNSWLNDWDAILARLDRGPAAAIEAPTSIAN